MRKVTAERIAEFLRANPEYAELLERIAEFEEPRLPELYPRGTYLGFEWHEVQARPAALNRLVVEGILKVTLKTHSATHYTLADPEETKKALEMLEEGAVGEAESAEPGPLEVPEDLFGIIVGYDDVKELILRSLRSERPVHFLLVGPPASAKTLFLLELSKVPGAAYALGSSSTKAGLAELLLEQRPRILLVDELDKVANMKDYAALLSLMETGIVSETKYKRRREARLGTRVFASANRTDGLPPELLSRFAVLRFREYDEAAFREVAERVLVGREGADPELARYLAERCLRELGTRDPREAVRLARLCRTKEDVDRVVGILLRYRRERE